MRQAIVIAWRQLMIRLSWRCATLGDAFDRLMRGRK